MRAFRFKNGDHVLEGGAAATVTGLEKRDQDVRWALDQSDLRSLVASLDTMPAVRAAAGQRVRAALEDLRRLQETTRPDLQEPEERFVGVRSLFVVPLRPASDRSVIVNLTLVGADGVVRADAFPIEV